MQFGVIIIHGLGFDTFPTLLLQTASYVVSFALVLLATAGSTYLRNTRTYFMAWNFCVAIAGCVIIRQCSVEQKWARYAGFCLVFAYVANFPLLMSMASGNFGGFTKKMTVNAFVRAAHLAFTANLWCARLTCFGLDSHSSLTALETSLARSYFSPRRRRRIVRDFWQC